LCLSGDLDLRRRGGERDLEDDLLRRRGGGERESDSDLTDIGEVDFGVGDLLRSSRLLPPRPLGTYVSDSLGGGPRNEPSSLESRRRGGGDREYRGPLLSNPLPPPRSKSRFLSSPRLPRQLSPRPLPPRPRSPRSRFLIVSSSRSRRCSSSRRRRASPAAFSASI
jgi:hypothetical protein